MKRPDWIFYKAAHLSYNSKQSQMRNPWLRNLSVYSWIRNVSVCGHSCMHMKAHSEMWYWWTVCGVYTQVPTRVSFASSYLLKQTWQADMHHSWYPPTSNLKTKLFLAAMLVCYGYNTSWKHSEANIFLGPKAMYVRTLLCECQCVYVCVPTCFFSEPNMSDCGQI